jgi:hypothetical protein
MHGRERAWGHEYAWSAMMCQVRKTSGHILVHINDAHCDDARSIRVLSAQTERDGRLVLPEVDCFLTVLALHVQEIMRIIDVC